MQGLEDLYQDHQAAGFNVVSVVVQDAVGRPPDADDADLWAEDLGLTYTVVADVDEEFFPVWDPQNFLPVAYIIDADGVVAWYELGGDLDEMEEQVSALLYAE